MITFAEAHPELVPEWAPSNGGDTPYNTSFGSNKKITWIGSCGHEWNAIVKNRSNGSGCPYCAGNRVLEGFNDLATNHPEISSEWSERNHPLYPNGVTSMSDKRAWWICGTCGHEWKSRIADRTVGHGCPVCSGEKLVGGVNDLETEHPDIASEWGRENMGLEPSMVWSKSRLNVWWRCRVCGHHWKGVVNSRVNGQKCPVCSDRVAMPGYNDLQTLYPKLAHEWCIERNKDLKPSMVLPKSQEIVHWQCRFGHIWLDKISDRVEGAGCPVCEENFRDEIKYRIVRYYAEKAGAEFIEGETDTIGIPLQIYFPRHRTAIEYCKNTRNSGNYTRRENAKNWLCLKSGIRLIRIMDAGAEEFDNCICITMEDESYGVLEAAISEAFRFGGIRADINLGRDIAEICGGMDTELLDRRSRSGLEAKWNQQETQDA
jgi:rubrerythrin